jgi:hypothetical protein
LFLHDFLCGVLKAFWHKYSLALSSQKQVSDHALSNILSIIGRNQISVFCAALSKETSGKSRLAIVRLASKASRLTK